MAAKRKTTKKPDSKSQKKTTHKKPAASNTTSNTRKKTTAKSTSASRKGGPKTSGADRMESFIGKELGLMALFALCILLFLSNLNLCGKVGAAAHNVMRGVFGLMGYVLPVWMLLIALFLLVNQCSRKAVIRAIVSFFMITFFCGVILLVTMPEYNAANTLKDYYTYSLSYISGGAIGGIYVKLLYPALGLVGSYVIMILLLMGAGVIVFQKSFLQPFEKGGRKAYEKTKDLERKRRERAALAKEQREREAEERAKAEDGSRSSHVVRGVTRDTFIEDESDTEDEPIIPPVNEESMASEEKKQTEAPVKKTGRKPRRAEITYPEDEKKDESSEKEKGPSADDIFIGSISGMNGRKPAGLSNEEEIVIEDGTGEDITGEETETAENPDAPIRAEKVKGAGADMLTIWQQKRPASETAEQPIEQPVEQSAEQPAEQPVEQPIKQPIKQPEEEVIDPIDPEEIHITKDGGEKKPEGTYDAVEQTAEAEIIVDSNGKQIIREIDPTEPDVLTMKRMQNKEAAKKAEGSVFRSADAPRDSSGAARFSGLGDQATVLKAGEKSPMELIPQKPKRPYVAPPIGLLKAGSKEIKNRDDELRETAVKLQQTLRNFNVGVSVTNISCGPTVTRYELTPEQGVKVAKIVSLQDDIKLSLAAADVRIEAPIPGKSAVGIEVPNRENMTVALRDILEADEFKNHKSRLAFGVGLDIEGGVVVTDMAKMPHLLIAGATGSGKSVCINTLIMSILYKAKPEEVKLLMIDPKVVELSVYNGIPHLLIPVVTDPKKASGALNWAVAEMTDRYKRFAEKNVRDLKGYNEKLKEEDPNAELKPQIVIVVDELADLMMVAPGEVEDAICRLAQMARAAGMHLVIATQRPSVNVITGLIKANVPSRIAFSVSSGIDSRTIIDMNGAEKLLGKGDMLFYPAGMQKPARVQGAFVSDDEVSAVVKFLSDRHDGTYDKSVDLSASAGAASDGSGGGAGGNYDELLVECGRFIIEKDKASIGMLQRAFKIGFNRAARIMDQLAEQGVVGEEEGTKPRKILMTLNEFNEYFGG